MVLVGVDEAGVGPAFGSLWACACHLPDGVALPGLTDSKKLTEKKREVLRPLIMEQARYGLGETTQSEIDTLGLAECRRLVFERALDDLVARFPDVRPSKIIVDGTLFRQWRGVPYELVPKADLTVACVSAASVLAKTSRDRQVVAWCDADPSLEERYGIRKNKGYLAPVHLQGLRTHGFTTRHRTSYTIKGVND